MTRPAKYKIVTKIKFTYLLFPYADATLYKYNGRTKKYVEMLAEEYSIV